jgi:hypothetical protein
MMHVLNKRIIEPWLAIEAFYAAAPNHGSLAEQDASVLVPAQSALHRISQSYALSRFNLRQAAEDLGHLLSYIRYRAQSGPASKTEMAYHLKCLAQAAFPVMPQNAAALYHALTGRQLGRFDMTPEAVARALPAGLFR